MKSIARELGLERDSGCVVIAEIAQAHDGSLGFAHAHIDAAAKAGADIVKFQTHIAAAETTRDEPWRVKFSPKDESRYEYWERMEFTESEWIGLREHAEEAGLGFLSTPFSPQAVELLKRVGVVGWKVASGEVTNTPMLRQMAATGLPVLISSGMSSLEELDAAVDAVVADGGTAAVFQCTSSYPSSASEIGLNVVTDLIDRYDLPVGLSDHSATIHAGVAAVTLGATLLEMHLSLSADMYGPDVSASLTVPEFTQLVEGVRFVETALANPVDKDAMAERFAPMRRTFQKSVVAACDLEPGTTLESHHLALKKPGTGLAPSELENLLGRRVNRSVPADEQLQMKDTEETQ